MELSVDVILVIIEYLPLCDVNALRIALYPSYGCLPNTHREVIMYTHLIDYYTCLDKEHITCMSRYHRLGKPGEWRHLEKVNDDSGWSLYHAHKMGLVTNPCSYTLLRGALFHNDLDVITTLPNIQPTELDELTLIIPKTKTTSVDVVRGVARVLFNKTHPKYKVLLSTFIYMLLCGELDVAAVLVCKDFGLPKAFIAKEYCRSLRVHRGKKFITYKDFLNGGKVENKRLKFVTEDDLKAIQVFHDTSLSAPDATIPQINVLRSVLNVVKVRLGYKDIVGRAPETAIHYDNAEHARACFNKYIEQGNILENFEFRTLVFNSVIFGASKVFALYDTDVHGVIRGILDHTFTINVQIGIRHKIKPGFLNIIKLLEYTPPTFIYNLIEVWHEDLILPLMDIVPMTALSHKNMKRAIKSNILAKVLNKAKLGRTDNIRCVSLMRNRHDLQDAYTDFTDEHAILGYIVTNRYRMRGWNAYHKYAHKLSPEVKELLTQFNVSYAFKNNVDV